MKRLAYILPFIAMLAIPCLASRTLTDEVGRKVVVPDHPHHPALSGVCGNVDGDLPVDRCII